MKRRPVTKGDLGPVEPTWMFSQALRKLDAGADSQRLLAVAAAYIGKWAELADRVEAGEPLDGRASIYTGETYAEARDRWAAYRDLLLDHLRGPDGVGH